MEKDFTKLSVKQVRTSMGDAAYSGIHKYNLAPGKDALVQEIEVLSKYG
jgi:hypothetical protein